MSGLDQESVELFLQEASEHLQYLREYSGQLQESQTNSADLEKLYIAAHTLAGTSASYGFPLFSEIAAKAAHIFHYALNSTLSPEMLAPLTEFIADAVSILESDLLEISSSGQETGPSIADFKRRYAFAFPPAPSEEAVQDSSVPNAVINEAEPEAPPMPSLAGQLPQDDEVPGEVLEFFLPEAEEHLQSITECLLALEGNHNPEEINRMFRSIHTLKGSAAQVGLHRLSSVAHQVEELIGRLRDGTLQPDAHIVDLCLGMVDVLKNFLYRRWPSDAEMIAVLDPMLLQLAEIAPEEPAEATETDAPVETWTDHPAEDTLKASLSEEPVAQPASQMKSVRISLERLDRMMNAVGELVINRTRMLGRLSELSKLVEVLTFSKGRLAGKVGEFQEKHEFNRVRVTPIRKNEPSFGRLRVNLTANTLSSDSPFEFSELEMDRYDDFNILSRSLTEISADVTEVLTQLEGFMGRVESDIDEFTKLAHHLQDEVTAARMVPIGTLYTRLSRTVRDAAKASGKPFELSLEGSETELDSNIIQHISDPLIHLVRNAVAHGIEDADARREAGKTEKGHVTVRAYHRGNHIFIEVEDDGRGIDYERVRQSVVDRGLASPVVASELSERDLREFLFRPGFSTVTSTSELAGRGVGLDVVRSNVHGLNGEIETRSEKGAGSCFTVKVPLTLIISQALFVRCGASVFALPLAFIEEIRRLRPEEIEEVGGKLLTRVRDVITEVVRLDFRLGLPPLEPVNGYFHMVIVRVAGKQTGIVIEEVLGKDELVIKNLGHYLRPVKVFPGATVASDGRLILLVDLNRLVSAESSEYHAPSGSSAAARVFAPGAEAVAAGSIPPEAVDSVEEERVVVVADDSISVRKFVGRILEKAGYRVRLASDGLEASEVILQGPCHLLITDLEMPRMNGYELIANLRQNPATRQIPVLVVTSRAGAKHRDRALKEGAAGFLTKPVQEDQLISTIASLIAPETGPQRREAVDAVREALK